MQLMHASHVLARLIERIRALDLELEVVAVTVDGPQVVAQLLLRKGREEHVVVRAHHAAEGLHLVLHVVLAATATTATAAAPSATAATDDDDAVDARLARGGDAQHSDGRSGRAAAGHASASAAVAAGTARAAVHAQREADARAVV